ncbi:hypothetical protein J6Z48_01720 [bacterium]|nr:hypothetical protein [bacterium]
MDENKTKKIGKKALLVVIAIIIVILTILLYLELSGRFGNSVYLTSPIHQDSLATSTQVLDISSVSRIPSGDSEIYAIDKNMKLTTIEKVAKELNLQQTKSISGTYYQWGTDDGSNIIYSVPQNYFLLYSQNGIALSNNVSSSTFSSFAKNYFGEDWQYSLKKEITLEDGSIKYLANRLTEDGTEINSTEEDYCTDYIIVKNNKLVGAKFLLTKFIKNAKLAPLISYSDLQKYINVSTYPKEFYPNLTFSESSNLYGIDYNSDNYMDIVNSIDDCVANTVDLVYYYNSFSQEYLTPVYKFGLTCDIKYKGETTYINAISFVNAINPNYVKSID